MNEKEIECNIIQLKKEEESEFQEFIKRLEADSLKAEKRVKKFKIMMILFGVYFATIVIAGISSIAYPPIRKFTDIYLLLCNLFSVVLCCWSLRSWYINKMYKEKEGWWLFTICVFGIVVNFVPYFLNW